MAAAYAKSKYQRISPRKMRYVADLIRGRDVDDALVQLRFSNCKAGRLIVKTLESAIANAETQQEMRRESLIVMKVLIDEGPRLKRWRPANKGRSHPICKRTSHITIEVGE